MRGETMEVVTPIATTSDKFVSVFIAKRGDAYVVTDGGWISEGKYDSDLPLLDAIYGRVFEYYKGEYNVNELAANNYIYYYKKTTDIRMVSSMVFDMASFTNGVVSASLINYQEKKELDNDEIEEVIYLAEYSVTSNQTTLNQIITSDDFVQDFIKIFIIFIIIFYIRIYGFLAFKQGFHLLFVNYF